MLGESWGQQNQCRLVKLNDDCLFEIFERVPIMDLCSIAQTSVRLNVVAKQFFAKKHISFIFINATVKTANQARKMFQIFGPQMLELEIDFCFCVTNASRIMEAVIRYCSSSLQRLVLKSFDIPDNRDTFTGMAKLFENLHTMHLDNVSIEGMGSISDTLFSPKGNLIDFFLKCKDLVNLSLIGGNEYHRPIFENSFPKLESFSVTTAEGVDGASYLEGFLLRHENLKAFSVIVEEYSDFDWLVPALKVIAAKCLHLEKLEFGLGAIFERPAESEILLNALFSIRKLKVVKVRLLEASNAIKELRNCSKNLEVLDVEFVGGNPELIPAVSQLQKLRSLRLHEIVDGDLKDINPLSKLTGLETLSIYLVENTKFDFLNLVNCLIKLTKLKFAVNSFKIDNDVYLRLLDIVDRRPDIRYRTLEIDCPRTSDFIDLQRKTVKFVRLIQLE